MTLEQGKIYLTLNIGTSQVQNKTLLESIYFLFVYLLLEDESVEKVLLLSVMLFIH